MERYTSQIIIIPTNQPHVDMCYEKNERKEQRTNE